MPTPVINSIELTSGSDVVLTTDPASPAYNEFYLTGSNLGNVTSVDLDSGSNYSWVVGSMSASANSITLSAYAFGNSAGTGTVVARAHVSTTTAKSPALEVGFTLLPLID